MNYQIPDPELDLLYQKISVLAEQLLEKHGEFYPFGISLDPDGQVIASSAECEEVHPDPSSVREQLWSGLGALLERGEVKAFAVAANVTFTPPGAEERLDAVQVTLRHQNGETLDIFAT